MATTTTTRNMRAEAEAAAIIGDANYEDDSDEAQFARVQDGRQIAYAQVLATLAVCDAVDRLTEAVKNL